MRLVIMVDIEESGLNSDEVKDNIIQFTYPVYKRFTGYRGR